MGAGAREPSRAGSTRLPRDAVQSDPLLCFAGAWTTLFLGELDSAEAWVKAAERCAPLGMTLDGVGSVEAGAAMVRAALGLHQGDVGRAGEMAREAVRLTEGETPTRAGPRACSSG